MTIPWVKNVLCVLLRKQTHLHLGCPDLFADKHQVFNFGVNYLFKKNAFLKAHHYNILIWCDADFFTFWFLSKVQLLTSGAPSICSNLRMLSEATLFSFSLSLSFHLLSFVHPNVDGQHKHIFPPAAVTWLLAFLLRRSFILLALAQTNSSPSSCGGQFTDISAQIEW